VKIRAIRVTIFENFSIQPSAFSPVGSAFPLLLKILLRVKRLGIKYSLVDYHGKEWKRWHMAVSAGTRPTGTTGSFFEKGVKRRAATAAI
jgi:hypothetical protein